MDAGGLEIKGGSSMLESSYQLRLATYRALVENDPLTILTGSADQRDLPPVARAVGSHGEGTGVIDYRYTSHQVARGSRPDAVSGTTSYLFKSVSVLRLTYQVRLLTFLAAERGGRLIIRMPRHARPSADLRATPRRTSSATTRGRGTLSFS